MVGAARAGLRVIALACGACGRIGFDAAQATVADANPAVAASFEAESCHIHMAFEIQTDTAASGGQYVIDNNGLGLQGPGNLLCTFAIDVAGSYYLWGRTISTDTASDSFFVSIDGGATSYYNTSDCVYSSQWHWAGLRTPYTCVTSLPALMPTSLAAGTHTIQFTSREGQAKIDVVLIARDDVFVPSG